MVKNIIIFAAGVGVGVIGTVSLLRKSYDTRLEAEIADSKAFYDEKVKRIMGEAENVVNEAKKAEKQANFDIPKPNKKEEEYDRDKIIEKLNYGAMYKGQKDDDEEDEEQEDIVMNSTTTRGGVPEIISDDEYYGDTEFDKETITYYSESKDFVTGKGEHIDYDEMINNIGKESYLEEFGGFETDTLFIRNHDKGIDYEIILEEREYDGE